ncbi:dephospho-CoA kinase [Candidatus Endowatersipora endosymbiont of Watersipora subatra]|uniref:dephospho-CoA kinase n=1 Tax=Candidatus Endowatersipora endosymbiont of Watersipora subatra TaxID=3077946 RepID=UPI00312C6FA9
MTLFIGLTGSIGMGKSTTASFFRDAGILVYDADAEVHDIYREEAGNLLESTFPDISNDQGIDRSKLSRHVIGNKEAMKKLEAIVHPLVQKRKQEFYNIAKEQNVFLAVLDIPLLFETASDQDVDGIVVVTAPADIQRNRVLARQEMSEKKFEKLLSLQEPDSLKQQKADFIIDTSKGIECARQQVLMIITDITSGCWQPQSKRFKN